MVTSTDQGQCLFVYIIIIIIIISHDSPVSYGIGLVAMGLWVRGSGSCNVVMLATGSIIHKNENLTGCDGYMCLINALHL